MGRVERCHSTRGAAAAPITLPNDVVFVAVSACGVAAADLAAVGASPSVVAVVEVANAALAGVVSARYCAADGLAVARHSSVFSSCLAHAGFTD